MSLCALASCGSDDDGAAPPVARNPSPRRPTRRPPTLPHCSGRHRPSPPPFRPTPTLPPRVPPTIWPTRSRRSSTRSMQPGALQWDCCGADGSPTGVSVAVRIPGRDDILLSSGYQRRRHTVLDDRIVQPRHQQPCGPAGSGVPARRRRCARPHRPRGAMVANDAQRRSRDGADAVRRHHGLDAVQR